MRNFKNIIVVMEPRQLRQIALERGLALLQAGVKAKITVVMPVHNFSSEITSALSVEQEDDVKQNLVAKSKKWLEAYLQVQAMGVDFDQRIISSKNIGKEITAIAKEIAADVIIKASDVHGLLDAIFFTPLDWQLLRHSPVPVVIAKENLWDPKKCIAVALDFSDPEDDEQRLINMRLLREAQEVAAMTHCQIHLVNAIPPILPPPSMDLPGFTPDVLGDEALKENCKTVLAFATRHKIPTENCHIREGQADEVIPFMCKELKPNMLFIGTSARRGLAVALLGNTCEKVIDDLDCDVVVITPKALKRKIPFASN